MALYVTGDTHGPNPHGYFSPDGFIRRFNKNNFPEQNEMTKDDYVIICGDFGGVWNYEGEDKEEKYNLDWLENKPFTTLFVPGNHENYDRLVGLKEEDKEKMKDSWIVKDIDINGYPQKLWHGGMVRELRPSVLMLERGYVFDICGKKCFAFGGARSHDIRDGIFQAQECSSLKDANNRFKEWYSEKPRSMVRVNHISWWKQEMPDTMEMERGLALLEDEKNKVDFIFTHDCPSSDLPFIGRGYEPDELNAYFEHVKKTVSYDKWVFGHYHDNKTIPGNKDMLVYEQIIRLA